MIFVATAPVVALAADPHAMRAEAERMRDQRHAELREALGVLTANQQARAWEIGGGGSDTWEGEYPVPLM